MTDGEAKRDLRARMRAARRECADRRARDERIFQNLAALAIYQKAPCVLSYVNFGTEADTHKILNRALADGKAVYVPRCVPNTNRMMFYRMLSFDELTPGAYGIAEPEENASNVYKDTEGALCLVPGLAFSPGGGRLGYGKGYYDTFFARHRALKIGLCYDFQLVPQIPMQPHDVRMDGILTDRTFLTVPEERME